MAMAEYMSLIIGLLVLLYVFYSQRQVRLVRREMRLTLPIILIIYGISDLVKFLANGHWSTVSLVSMVLSLLFLACGMGAVRAFTVSLWADDSGVWRQGTWLTIGLWLVSVALHLVVDQIGGTGQSTLLLYYGITLAVQRWVVQYRAKRNL